MISAFLHSFFISECELQHDKTNKMTVRPAKTQISLGIRPVWSESSLSAQWVAKDPSFLPADSEDSDQTGRMLVLSWGGSFDINSLQDRVTDWFEQKHKFLEKQMVWVTPKLTAVTMESVSLTKRPWWNRRIQNIWAAARQNQQNDVHPAKT